MFRRRWAQWASICRLRQDNLRSQIAFTNAGLLDGDLGRTFTKHGSHWIWQADIALSEDAGTRGPIADPAAFLGGDVGDANRMGRMRNVFLHELGHALGLAHDINELAQMRTPVTELAVSDAYPDFSAPLPDDISGAREFYAGGGTDSNITPLFQTFFDDLPNSFQSRFVDLNGDPEVEPRGNGTSARIISYNRFPAGGRERNWAVFNPSPEICASNNMVCASGANGFPPATPGILGMMVDELGVPRRVMTLCEGSTFFVPFGVIDMDHTLPAGASEHRITFWVGDESGILPDVGRFEDGILDVDHEQDGAVIAGVHQLRLQMDPDCWDQTTDYFVWMRVDSCDEIQEELETGDSGENDNLIRTDVRFRIGGAGVCTPPPPDDGVCEPLDADCAPGGGGTGGTGSTGGSGGGGGGGYDPQCDDQAEGTCPGGPCAPTEPFADPLDPFSSFHPDGDGGGELYCEGEDLVCVNEAGLPICRRCGDDTNLGCPCSASLGCEFMLESLDCYGGAAKWGGSQGFCWDAVAGPPRWQCSEGCTGRSDFAGNADYYCYHDTDVVEHATCISDDCSVFCAASSIELTCNAGQDQVCINECQDPATDCGVAFGYPSGTVCTSGVCIPP